MEKTVRRARAQASALAALLQGESLSKLRLRAALHLLFAMQEMERDLGRRLANEFGETLPRLDVLAALSRVPQGMTMTQLSGSLRLSKGNITGLIGRLVRDGLVGRKAIDGRSSVVALTAKGRGLFGRMAKAHEGWVNELLQSLSQEELHGLIGTVTKLRKAR